MLCHQSLRTDLHCACAYTCIPQRQEERQSYCDDCDANSHHTKIFMSADWADLRLCWDCITANEVWDSKWEPIWGPADDYW